MTTTTIPTNKAVLSSLLRADFTTQWRNRKSVILILLIPVIILIAWQGLVNKLGGAFVLANCIAIGLNAIGLMGYSNAIARDRDKGIFQRLRVAPLTAWSIMASRLAVQLAMILLVTTSVFVAGYYVDHITLSPAGYAVGFAMAFVGGAVYLGLGQAIVGLIKNAETVNAVTRLVYFVFIMVGMLAELGAFNGLGDKVVNAVKWSPYGTVKHILSAGMQPATWNQHSSMALLVTIGYALVFSALGIKWFKWSSK
ncbi:MAG TPA: ABC transporter permease [Chitinophagaceae bacterium]|nr:ABC transporter permease [Chitinophagaceae bacterium]